MNLNKTYFACSKIVNSLRTNCRYLKLGGAAFSEYPGTNKFFFLARATSSFTIHQEKCLSSYSTLPKENLFCHKILEDTSNYSLVKYAKLDKEFTGVNSNALTVEELLSQTNFSQITAHELCDLFRKVSLDAATKTFLPMSDSMYNDLFSAIEMKANNFTDNDLATVLMYSCFWPMSESLRADNFFKFWKTLDQECLVRWREWPLKKMFYFIDLWFTFRLIRMSDFVYNCINFLGKKPSRLSAHEVVQLMFYVNAMRTAVRSINMFEIEHRLEEVISSLSLAEIGIIALGFFKTQTRMQNDQLVKYMIQRLVAETNTVSEITLSSILKCVRLSMTISAWSELPRLLDSLVPQLNRVSLQCNIHVALLTTTSQTLHPSSLGIIVSRLLKELSTARLKDMEKVMFVVSQYNWQPPGENGGSLAEKITAEIRRPERKAEIHLHPKSFVALINYLTIVGHYPYDFIDQILKMDFIEATYGKNKYVFGRELLCINSRIEIECKDYTGSRLSPELANYLSMRYSQYLPNPEMKMSNHSQFMHDIKRNLISVLGENKVCYLHAVPFHPRADIVYRTGTDEVLPNDILERKPFTGAVPAPRDGFEWHAVIPASKNMFLSDKTPNGETQAKLRALNILGYRTHLISVYEWQKLQGKIDMRDFLSRELGL